ncbi:hypothetical protein [Streptomyces sp. NPDC001389]|uniref:hypothetical protein n=1 Tax=Streptomyces sp. NPDC001389 TaxID=3364569 RepID=UPI003693CE73
MAALLCTLGQASAPAYADPPPPIPKEHEQYHAKVGPPDPIPKEWDGAAGGGWQIGLDNQRKYCQIDPIGDFHECHPAEGGELPGKLKTCENADGTAADIKPTPTNPASCDKEAQKEFELKRLKEWQEANKDKQNLENYPKLNAALTKCVNEGKPFKACQAEFEKDLPLEVGLKEWAAGKFSEFAASALKEAANYIGKSVVWLLHEFADKFNKASTIDLTKSGINNPLAISTTVSALLAALLLLLQFGKTAISQRGEAAGTALAGLGKWALITPVYLVFTQQALRISDELSTWIINFTFTNGGQGTDAATRAMQEQLGTMFGGLIAGGGGGATAAGAVLISGATMETAAVGVIIVVGIICIMAIGALWIEVLLRQAGILILCATMPITLAGQINEGTSDWWPKARQALIGLIVMKPAIVLCFSIGFSIMAGSSGVQNMIVGLLIFVAACFCWPVIAKFMTFTSNGDGNSAFSGLMSSIGSSASSRSGGGDGAGAVGGGSGYTKALEQEATAPTDGGSGSAVLGGAARKGVFAGAGSVAAVGLQLAAVGKDTLESGMGNTAANAGLGHGAAGGRHVVIGRQRAGGAQPGPSESEVPEVVSPVGGFVEVPPPPPRQGVRTSPAEPTQMYDGTQPMDPPGTEN